METIQIRSENENTEEDIDLISFRKTNTSVEENLGDLDHQELVLGLSKHRQKLTNLQNEVALKSSQEEIKCDEDFKIADSVEK